MCIKSCSKWFHKVELMNFFRSFQFCSLIWVSILLFYTGKNVVFVIVMVCKDSLVQNLNCHSHPLSSFVSTKIFLGSETVSTEKAGITSILHIQGCQNKLLWALETPCPCSFGIPWRLSILLKGKVS